jgi:hypothetical protein
MDKGVEWCHFSEDTYVQRFPNQDETYKERVRIELAQGGPKVSIGHTRLHMTNGT